MTQSPQALHIQPIGHAHYVVESASTSGTAYAVDLAATTCSCDDWHYRSGKRAAAGHDTACKHIRAARAACAAERVADLGMLELFALITRGKLPAEILAVVDAEHDSRIFGAINPNGGC